jgi:tetratricopeptide (TPR) repeat protein
MPCIDPNSAELDRRAPSYYGTCHDRFFASKLTLGPPANQYGREATQSMMQPVSPNRARRTGSAGVLAALCCALLISVAAVAQDATQQAMSAGAAAMKAADYQAAVAAYTSVTEKMPQFAEGQFNLGLAQLQAGKLDEAHESLQKALQLKPGLRGANLFLGTIAYKQNHFKDAESLLLRETRLDPRNAQAFMWIGVCRLAQDDAQGAIAPLDKAFALDPANIDILYHRGRAYLLVANASYAAMFKLDRDSLRVHQVLAEADAKAYRTVDAINEFELAVKMAPRQPGLHEELGDQYWVNGQLDKVAEAYREELRIDPNAVTAMYKLGSLLVLNQSPAEGVQLLTEALKADPTLTDAHYYLGQGLAAMDQDAEAIGEFQLAVAADPKGELAMTSYYKLVQVYRKLHKSAEAQTALANFQQLRAAVRQRQERKSEQIARKRTQLPVDDPEKEAISTDPGDK